MFFEKPFHIYQSLSSLFSSQKAVNHRSFLSVSPPLHCNHTQRFAMHLPSFLSINAVAMCSACSTLFLPAYDTVKVVPCSFRPELNRAGSALFLQHCDRCCTTWLVPCPLASRLLLSLKAFPIFGVE